MLLDKMTHGHGWSARTGATVIARMASVSAMMATTVWRVSAKSAPRTATTEGFVCLQSYWRSAQDTSTQPLGMQIRFGVACVTLGGEDRPALFK